MKPLRPLIWPDAVRKEDFKVLIFLPNVALVVHYFRESLGPFGHVGLTMASAWCLLTLERPRATRRRAELKQTREKFQLPTSLLVPVTANEQSDAIAFVSCLLEDPSGSAAQTIFEDRGRRSLSAIPRQWLQFVEAVEDRQ